MSKNKLVKCRVRKNRKYHGIKPRNKVTDVVIRFTATEGDTVHVTALQAKRFSSSLQTLEDFDAEERLRKERVREAQAAADAAKNESTGAAEVLEEEAEEESEEEESEETEEAEAKDSKESKPKDSKKSG